MLVEWKAAWMSAFGSLPPMPCDSCSRSGTYSWCVGEGNKFWNIFIFGTYSRFFNFEISHFKSKRTSYCFYYLTQNLL